MTYLLKNVAFNTHLHPSGRAPTPSRGRLLSSGDLVAIAPNQDAWHTARGSLQIPVYRVFAVSQIIVLFFILFPPSFLTARISQKTLTTSLYFPLPLFFRPSLARCIHIHISPRCPSLGRLCLVVLLTNPPTQWKRHDSSTPVRFFQFSRKLSELYFFLPTYLYSFYSFLPRNVSYMFGVSAFISLSSAPRR